ncbi:MAG: histidinol dehydrogenase [Geminicoccaceae bacterium]
MTERVAFHRLSQLSDGQRDELLRRSEDDLGPFLEKVDPIIEAVRDEGDDALRRFARDFDKASVDDLAASEADFDRAFNKVGAAMVEVLTYAADNIRRFHQAQMPGEMWMKEIRPGVLVGERVTPISSVACYSPRGKGSFPSVTLMTTIPAVVAGVPAPSVLTPPGPDGAVDPATLVACRLAGVDKVFKVGGAQAVAAAAFGTATIPRCRKFVGPGSPWVAAAKQRLAGEIDPGLPAGPSESIILADETANPEIAALDLIIESEHGHDSSAFLVTWSEVVTERAIAAIPEYWSRMGEERVGYSSTVLGGNSGGVLLTPDAASAYTFINDYAPEHLQIISKTPFEHLAHIENASEILLGEHAAGSIANYMMGPNCVLPTSGAAHTRSALGVRDFLKSSSIGHMTRRGFDEMAPKTKLFAEYEGFDAHANAVSALRAKLLDR